MNARDKIRKVIYQSNRANTQIDLKGNRRLKGSQLAWAGYAADALMADGHRKPIVIGYAVVGGKSGQFVRSFGADERDAALAFADESTRDCADMGIDFDYRVAEIVEAGS
ncbi:hypothetical protein [Arthrobacter sp. efr-133-R2A-63]|uniref:hypothetical protein n=1 Tax=Arthrobacter sp. efr-133-R2A-63 TaxID=3040278 RepID=UPI002549EBD2|nr:hypothetical protein [Arthrobacter sp. efr-133-R2A-63]